MAAVGLRKKINLERWLIQESTVELGARQLRVSSHPEETLRESQEMFPPPLPQRATQMMVEFFRAEERRAQRDEERVSNGRKSKDLQQSNNNAG